MTLDYEGKNWKVDFFGKAHSTDGKGEPKTDIVIMLSNPVHGENLLKISMKQSNYEFIENKMLAHRILSIPGLTEFLSEDYFASFSQEHTNRTKLMTGRKSSRWNFNLGARLDIMTVPGNKNPKYRCTLNDKSIIREAYVGEFNTVGKRNIRIEHNGKQIIIPNGGIPNLVSVVNGKTGFSPQDILDSAIPIDKYTDNIKSVHLALRNINWRFAEKDFTYKMESRHLMLPVRYKELDSVSKISDIIESAEWGKYDGSLYTSESLSIPLKKNIQKLFDIEFPTR